MAQSQFAPPAARRGFRFSTREITITAALGAVTIVMGLVPRVGLLPPPPPAPPAPLYARRRLPRLRRPAAPLRPRRLGVRPGGGRLHHPRPRRAALRGGVRRRGDRRQL